MINLMDSLESNQASLSDWLLVVGNGEDMTRKAYKSLGHQRRDAETSSSGVTVWVLHLVLGLSTLPTTSELVSYRPQSRTLSSYVWSAGLELCHVAQDGRERGIFSYFFSDEQI